MRLPEVQNKILNGPDDNVERLTKQKDKQIEAGIDCKVVYLADINSYAVIRSD